MIIAAHIIQKKLNQCDQKLLLKSKNASCTPELNIIENVWKK